MENGDRILTEQETEQILAIREIDITEGLLMNLFARRQVSEPPKHSTNDVFILPVGACCNNKKSGATTIGLYIFNKFLIEPHFADLIGYVNKPITGKVFESIEDVISTALYNNEINTDSYADYINRAQWLGGNSICSIISPSITAGLLKSPEGLAERKKELIEKNKDAILKGDPMVGVSIEKELIAFSKAKVKEDPGFENFESGAKVSFDNNFKTTMIMKGPLLNNSTGEYTINFSEYNSGISKSEYANIADSAVAGAYARSTAVATGGYLAKRSHQTLNTVTADEPGSDCGTTEYLEIFLDSFFKEEYLYRYIIVDGKLVLLDENNFSQYANRVVQMRSPMFCHTPEPCYCSKCIGEQPYKINLRKIGLAIARASNTLLNAQLKRFHDLTVKISTIDETKILVWDIDQK